MVTSPEWASRLVSSGLPIFGSVLALAAMATSKEKDVVEFRSKWLEVITADLSTVLAMTDYLTRLAEEGKAGMTPQSLKEFRETHKAEYTRMNEAYFRTSTRLGPTHHELKTALDSLMHEFFGSFDDIATIQRSQLEVRRAAGKLFGSVWRDIKRGNWVFRAMMVVLGLLIILALLGSSNPAQPPQP